MTENDKQMIFKAIQKIYESPTDLKYVINIFNKESEIIKKFEMLEEKDRFEVLTKIREVLKSGYSLQDAYESHLKEKSFK